MIAPRDLAGIPGETDFYRAIFEKFYKPERPIPLSPAAFQNTSGTDRMSVNLAEISSVQETESQFPGYGVAVLAAKPIRECGQTLIHSPQPDNRSHCDVVGVKPLRARKAMRDAAVVISIPQAHREP